MSEKKPGKLDEFLAYLAEGGEWQSLDDMAQAIQITERKVLKVARLFARFGFVEFDRKAGRVRIDQKVRALYMEEKPP